MRIFVSSRMSALLERKAAIDAVHLAEHQPLYIETEEYVQNRRKLKSLMRRMLKQADAFVGIYHDALGTQLRELGGDTPVTFELNTFLEELKERHLDNKAKQRIILFRKARQSTDARMIIRQVTRGRKGGQKPHVATFREYDDLLEKVFYRVRELEDEPARSEPPRAPMIINVEYHGKDKAGLLGVVSEYLFTKYGVNIEYVWGSSRGERALLHMSAGFHGEYPDGGSLTDLKKDLSRRVAHHFGQKSANISVSPSQPMETDYAYVEIRSIDAPGQLNTVCKAIRELDLSISQIHLAPAPLEFPRQTVIAMKVPLNQLEEGLSRRARFLRLEAKLRDLVGVQAISTRFSRRFTDAAERSRIARAISTPSLARRYSETHQHLIDKVERED